MRSDLLTPATAELLAGWCGPVVFDGTTAVVVDDGTVTVPGWGWQPLHEHAPRLSLDLSRAECRDWAARVLAKRVGVRVGTAAPRWEGAHDGWRLCGEESYTGNLRLFTADMRGRTGGRLLVHVPALDALDPSDDTRLPDGSRHVDALALRLCLEATRG